MLMRVIVDSADVGTCRAMQAAALSSGVWLRHFYNALFAPSLDQRYVSVRRGGHPLLPPHTR